MSGQDRTRKRHLQRLPDAHYQGQAIVHWTMTLQNRATGWLKPIFYYKFRELLTHTMFRYGLCCPIYCCMPDHLHLLWLGLSDGADQRNAVKFFRKHLNSVFEKLGVRLQKQPFDHVLSEDERREDAFKNLVEYIAQNPERSGLVAEDHFLEYPFTGSLFPGYPELYILQPDGWERFGKVCSYLRSNGLGRYPLP